MERVIDVDVLLKDLGALYNARDGQVTYDDVRNYIDCSSKWLLPFHKLQYMIAISKLKNYKQVVIDTVGDCEFARGLQKAIDIIEEDI